MLTDLLVAFLVPAALVGILFLAIGGARPSRGEGSAGARRFRAFRRYQDPSFSDPTWFAVVVVAALAVATWAPDVVTAGVLGVITAVVATASRYLGDLWVSALGVVGAFVTAQQLVTSGGCFDVPLAVRILSVSIVVVVGLPAFALGRHLPGNSSSTSIAVAALSLFAAVDVVAFLSTPLGVPVLSSGSVGLIVTTVLASVVLGLGFGYAPVLGAVLLGAAVAVVSVSSAAWFGTSCSFAGNWNQVTAAVVFVVVAGVLRTLGARVTGRV